jgi:thiamine biosynthesis protein ThiS
MKINLNNHTENLAVESCTVSDLLVMKNYTFKMLIVKINGRLVKKEDYENSVISEGDDVIVLHLISGG